MILKIVKSPWALFFAECGYFLINLILRYFANCSNNLKVVITLQIITSVFAIITYFLPYLYSLYYLSNTSLKPGLKRSACFIVKVIVFYLLFPILFKPYPGDFISTVIWVIKIPELYVTLLIFFMLMFSFFMSSKSKETLSCKDKIISGTFMALLEFMVIRIIMLATTIYLYSHDLIIGQVEPEKILSDFDHSIIANYKWIMLLSFISFLLTFSCAICFLKKNGKKLFHVTDKVSSLINTVFNALFISIVFFISKKNYMSYIIAWIVLLVIMFLCKKYLYKWFDRYVQDIFNNSMQILLIGTIYTFGQPDEIKSYISEDLTRMLISIIVLWSIGLIIKRIGNSKKSVCDKK